MTGGSPGDRREQFEQLAHQVWEPLRRYLLRRDAAAAEDLLSDVLLVLWRRLDDVPDGFALPWAYKVAQGCLANHQRRQQRELRLLKRLKDEPPVAAPADDERLAEAMAGLRPGDQEVLRLWAWEGLEARDLAVVLDITPNAAAVRLSRARAALKQELEGRLGKDRAAAGHKQEREERVPGHE